MEEGGSGGPPLPLGATASDVWVDGCALLPGTQQLGYCLGACYSHGPRNMSWGEGSGQHGLWDMYSCGQPVWGKAKGMRPDRENTWISLHSLDHQA